MDYTYPRVFGSIVVYFRDPLYGRERIGIVVIVLTVILVSSLLAYFLVTKEEATQLEASKANVVATPFPPPPPEPPEVIAARQIQEKASAAHAAIRTGDFPLARESLEGIDLEAAALPAAWHAAGKLRMAESDFPGAIEIFNRGIASAPSPHLYYFRGMARWASGDQDGGLADVEKAAELSPSEALFTNQRLLLLIASGQSGLVRREISTFVETGNVSENQLWIFGLIALQLADGDFNNAVTLLDTARYSIGPNTRRELLSSPAISKFQSDPRIQPFFFGNSQ